MSVRSWMWFVVAACGSSEVVDTDATDSDTDADTGPASETDPYAGLPPTTDPVPYSKGACPTLVEGVNADFASSTRANRTFILHEPKRKKGAGVLFLWHGNGDTMANFDAYTNAKALADQLGVITITPEAGSGGLGLDWAVPPNPTKPDATFFDDLLSCVNEQYDIDLRRVYTAGFSAGALWSSWLVMNRAEHLASAVIFSGGTDGSVAAGVKVNPYSKPAWRIPVIMTAGGTGDVAAVISFTQTTTSMSNKLRDDGSTVVVCTHNQGHTPPSGFDAWAWDFLDAHVHRQLPSAYKGGADPSGALPNGCAWE